MTEGRLSQLEAIYADCGSRPYYQHITEPLILAFPLTPLLTVSSHRRLGFQTSKKKKRFKTLVWVIGSVFVHSRALAVSLQERTLQKNYKDIWHFPKEQNHDTQFRSSGGKKVFLRVHETQPIYVHLSTLKP